MNKKFFYLMLVLLGWSTGINSQVAIGTLNDPHESAILDLQSTSLGLLLPNVHLENVNIFQLSQSQSAIDKATGMVVFNTNKEIIGGYEEGIYVWYGNKWHSTSCKNANENETKKNTDFSISGDVIVNVGETITLTAAKTVPDDSDWTVAWSVEGSAEYGDIVSTTGLTCDITGLKPGGSVLIKALSIDGVEKTYLIDVIEAVSYDYTLSGKDIVSVGETITITATKDGPNNPDWTVSWSVEGSAEYGDIDSTTGLTCDITGLKPGGSVLIKALSIDGVEKTYLIDVIEAVSYDYTLSGKETVNVGETITITAIKDGQNNPDWTITWTVDGSVDYGKISSSTATTCNVTGVKAGGTVLIKAVSMDGIEKTLLIAVTSKPCEDSNFLIQKGAYEAINPAKNYDGNSASSSIISSSYFKQKGDLCIKPTYASGADLQGTWSASNAQCTGDWRMPNLAELATIKKQPATTITNKYYMNTAYRYWSSTPSSTGHWYFKLDTDNALSMPDTSSIAVRCVRTIN
jgi:uncharacterized protein YjdB